MWKKSVPSPLWWVGACAPPPSDVPGLTTKGRPDCATYSNATARGNRGGRMSDVVFTHRQREAIDVSRRHLDACVVAGPGSGKTTVLVEYFRKLVEADVDPLRILAITFTEKAAGNMRKKLALAFEDAPAVRAALERAWVSTVHGFCARLLRENAVFAGVDPEFQVADEREPWRMQQEAMAGAMESLFREQPQGV